MVIYFFHKGVNRTHETNVVALVDLPQYHDNWQKSNWQYDEHSTYTIKVVYLTSLITR